MGSYILSQMSNKWSDIKTIEHYASLYDAYGSLLTDRQAEMVQAYLFDDLSFTEIGDNLEISRQAVHEQVTKACDLLEEYEAKLGFLAQRRKLKQELTELLKITELQELEAGIQTLLQRL